MKNFQFSLKYEAPMRAFAIFISAETDTGKRMQWVRGFESAPTDNPPPPLWKEYEPFAISEPSFYMQPEELFYVHRELSFYGPFKDDKPPDMEQIKWLRGLVERELFE